MRRNLEPLQETLHRISKDTENTIYEHGVGWKLAKWPGLESCDQWHKVQLGTGSLWWSILGWVLFISFINDLDDGTGCILSMFARDRKVRGVTGTPKGWSAIQEALDRLAKWADRNLCSSIKEDVKSWPWEGITPSTSSCWAIISGKQLYWKGHGEPVGQVISPCNKGQQPPALHEAEGHQQVKGGHSSPLLALVRHKWRAGPAVGISSARRNMDTMEWVQQKAIKLLKDLDYFWDKGLRQLALFGLEERRSRESYSYV